MNPASLTHPTGSPLPTLRRGGGTLLRVALALALAAALPATGRTQAGYVFTKVVDNNDPRPDRPGQLFRVGDEPALDRDGRIVFRDGPGSLSPDSIWAVAPGEETPTRLADFSTPVPGGVGNFSSFILFFSLPGIPAISDGEVVFAGRDSNSSAPGGFNAGLYSVPATGGAVRRVFDYQTPLPGTGPPNNGLASFSFDAGRVAFAATSSAGGGGVYAVNSDGSGAIAIADGDHPAGRVNVFDINLFDGPSINQGRVLYYGQTVFDPSTGFNALYTTPANVSFAYNAIVDNSRDLPGQPGGTGQLRLGDRRLDGDRAVFVADDASTNPSFFGIFSVPAAGGPLAKIVTSLDALPGLTNINNNSFRQFAARDGLVAFEARDNSSNISIFLADAAGAAAPARFVGTGDPGPFADTGATVGNINVNPLNLGPGAVSNGRITLRIGGGTYLATPAGAAADVRAALAHAPAGPAAVGATLTYTFAVTNAGPAPAAGVRARLTLPPGLTFLSSSTGGAAPDGDGIIRFPDTLALAAGQTLTFTVQARVDLPGGLTASAFASSATPDADGKNNHARDLVAPPVPTGAYGFTRIVDTATPVPDRPGEFFRLPGGNAPLPAVDGGRVVFVDLDPDNRAVLWGAPAGGGAFTRLVDRAVPMPGGGGDTFANVFNLRLRNGTAAFVGFGNGEHSGIFSVPAAGGAVVAAAHQDTPRPEDPTKTFGFQGFNQSFGLGYLGDGRIGFVAQGGVYAYPVAGGGTPRVVVHPGTSLSGHLNRTINGYNAPALSGGRAVFEASNGTLLSTFFDERRFVSLADLGTPSPSAPGVFTFSFNGNFQNAQAEGDTVAFAASGGEGAATVRGLYSLTGTRGAPVVRLVDTNSPVPGGTGNFTSFTVGGSPEVVALSAGEVVFAGIDAANRVGLYSVPARGGAITKIVAAGDSLGNGLTLTGFSQPLFQANGLGGGQVVFRADFFDAGANRGAAGIFVATPASLARAPFFAGEIPLSNDVYFLRFPATGLPFGYYSYLSDPRFIYHFDLGYEYWFDAQNATNGIFFYDFQSQGFFYTSPSFPFPFLYDFSLGAVLYYFPNPNNPERYNTDGVRYFYNYATGQIITR